MVPLGQGFMYTHLNRKEAQCKYDSFKVQTIISDDKSKGIANGLEKQKADFDKLTDAHEK
jgi:hypothetical protein